jgi:hypothetical protein
MRIDPRQFSLNRELLEAERTAAGGMEEDD